jgi:hypothetical protein
MAKRWEPERERAPVPAMGESPSRAMRWAAPGCTLAWIVVAALIGAAFPGLVHWARWPTRLGVRNRLLYVAWNTVLIFVMREFARSMREEHERGVGELRGELGREPSHEELRTRLARHGLRAQLGREPTERELLEFLGRLRRS